MPGIDDATPRKTKQGSPKHPILDLSRLCVPANGIDLGTTGQINGFGTVASAIAGDAGSQINATGILSLGDAGSTSGFDFAGALDVGSNQVVILDADRAQLGSSTTLGSGGTLGAMNGFDLTSGETLFATGDSLIQGQFTNNGVVDVAAGQTLIFNDDVDGAGSYTGDGTVQFNQAFSPGNSPAAVAFGGDVMLTSTSVLEIELGGAAGTDFDQLVVTNTATIAAGSTLDVDYIDPFVAALGDSFQILGAGTLSGAFDSVDAPDGQNWIPDYDYVAGTARIVVAQFGDATLDGTVGLSDLTALADNYGLTVGATWKRGDFTLDGTVGLADLLALADNYGWTAGDTPVPEPVTLVLLAVGGLALIRPNRRLVELAGCRRGG